MRLASIFSRRLRLGIFCFFVATCPAYPQKAPEADALMSRLHMDQEASAKLIQGEVVSFAVTEQGDTELAAGVAAYLSASPDKVINLINRGNLASIETDIVASGSIPDSAGEEVFRKFVFSSKQSNEAESFLEAEAGDEFNLSAADLAVIQGADIGDKKATQVASEIYQHILFNRWQAYRKSGLNGIANYKRGEEEVSAASELREMAQSNKVLAEYFPELFKAWLDYPTSLPENSEEQFLWLNLTVENRPTPILAHRVFLASNQGSVILSRQYYVGHSYNASQLTIACLPYRDGTLLFYASRTSTDQVAGMGQALKHSIGREQMRSTMVQRIQRLKQLL